MSEALPPPLPPVNPAVGRQWTGRRFIAGCLVALATLASVSVVILRFTGLLGVFALPTGGMTPAINPGDRFFVEGVTYLFSQPERGDVVVFKTDDIPVVRTHELYVKRLIGLPGDHLHLSKGTIYVNGQPTIFRNRNGEIRYPDWPIAKYLADDFTTYIVPEGQYFVIGDRSTNSTDSRLWGGVPQRAVVGRAVYCYLPLKHLGSIK